MAFPTPWAYSGCSCPSTALSVYNTLFLMPSRHGQGQVDAAWGRVSGGGLGSCKEGPQGQASLGPEKQKQLYRESGSVVGRDGVSED